MIHTLLGRGALPHAAWTCTSQRHDGQAVTCDDFVAAMAGRDRRRPHAVHALVRPGRHAACSRSRGSYDAAAHTLHARRVQQSLPADARAAREAAVAHPARRRPGRRRTARDLPLQLAGEAAAGGHRARAVAAREPEQRFVFVERAGAAGAVAAARLLRAGRSLQLRLQRRRARAPDGARHRPVQPLGGRPAARDAASCCAASRRVGAGQPARGSRGVRRRLRPRARRRRAAIRPSPPRRWRCRPRAYLAEQMDVVDPDAIHAVRLRAARATSPRALRGELLAAYQALHGAGPYSPDARVGRPARPAQPVPRLPDGARRRRRRARCACAQFDTRRQHDRRDGRARRARQLRLRRARAGAASVLRQVEGRAAGGRQVAAVQATSRLPGHAGARSSG